MATAVVAGLILFRSALFARSARRRWLGLARCVVGAFEPWLVDDYLHRVARDSGRNRVAVFFDQRAVALPPSFRIGSSPTWDVELVECVGERLRLIEVFFISLGQAR